VLRCRRLLLDNDAKFSSIACTLQADGIPIRVRDSAAASRRNARCCNARCCNARCCNP
jgi:hypothetical protein